MNRVQLITLKLLEVLHTMPGGQCAEGVLKGSIDLLIHPNSLRSEFDEALQFAETNDWILGIRPVLGATKWSITDAGRSEHLKNRSSRSR